MLKTAKKAKAGPTDRPTDRQTDEVTYRVALHATKNLVESNPGFTDNNHASYFSTTADTDLKRQTSIG